MASTSLTTGFGSSFPFGRLSPFFIDVPGLAGALKEFDDAMDISQGDGRQQQRAILLDVKEV
jgi:hypothetical protein